MRAQVVRGWDETVGTMRKGEARRQRRARIERALYTFLTSSAFHPRAQIAELTCPPEFAYGEAGAPPVRALWAIVLVRRSFAHAQDTGGRRILSA